MPRRWRTQCLCWRKKVRWLEGGDKETVTTLEVERSLSIPLAKEEAIISASDISAAMVAEAEMKAKQQLPAENLPRFEVNDLESLRGKYNTVMCLDVLIHYTQNKADDMIAHLASLAEKRVILSFAPKIFYRD